jgi:hypothetical protein
MPDASGVVTDQVARVRTRVKDLERYLEEHADVARDAHRAVIDVRTYVGRAAAIDRAYAGRVSRADCCTFDSLSDYRAFFTRMVRHSTSPSAPDALACAIRHEEEHMAALAGFEGVTARYGCWFALDDAGNVWGMPNVFLSGPLDKYLEARRRCVGAPRRLSRLDARELGEPYDG